MVVGHLSAAFRRAGMSYHPFNRAVLTFSPDVQFYTVVIKVYIHGII